MGHQSYFW